MALMQGITYDAPLKTSWGNRYGQVFVTPFAAAAFAVLLALTACPAQAFEKEKAAPEPPATASAPVPEVEADQTQSCAKAGDSPVCVLKAWLACVLYDSTPACKAATGGLISGQKAARTSDKEVVTAPWSVPFDRLMPEAFGMEIFDGSDVPVERMAVYGQDANGKAMRMSVPDMIPKTGVYEMFVKSADLDAEGWMSETSVLLTRDKNVWRVVGWSSTRPRACAFDPRAAAKGTVGWQPCRMFIPRVTILDLANYPRLPVWRAPKYASGNPYPHRGVDVQVNMSGERIPSPMTGIIARRPRVYVDTNAYDWVVISGKRDEAPLEMKMAYVSTDGPAVGTKVDPTATLGRQQSLSAAYPHMNEFVHWEVVIGGHNVDPTPFRAAGGN